ncbi:MAG: aldolase [Acidobacteriaceae bacterium]|nr:aldolase [Acidobacteriaceae bacterium]MBV9442447.1 aldolase [Acidobacteriaceae bacterium]
MLAQLGGQLITSVRNGHSVTDPLLTRCPLNYERTFYPYGYPARIRSNSPLTLQAAESSWGTYRQLEDEPPLDIRLLISDSDSLKCVEPPVFRSQGHLLSIVADRENFASLDLQCGFAFGWATTATAKNQGYFRQCLLDVMVYPLLEIRNLVSLHAACLIFQGKGTLLAGASGAGKSSLSYACARRGWTFVSDDTSAFRRNLSEPRVIGHPHKFRFRDNAATLFPELKGHACAISGYGKPTVEVLTHTIAAIQTAEESSVDAIVFLNRHDHKSGPPQLLPLTTDESWERLSASIWAVQMTSFEERLEALERLLAVPTFEMRYSELAPAIGLLEGLLPELPD